MRKRDGKRAKEIAQRERKRERDEMRGLTRSKPILNGVMTM